jgi:uncharacterized repeat protein (TIGR02543 family)
VLHNNKVYSPEWLLNNTERAIFGELIPLDGFQNAFEIIAPDSEIMMNATTIHQTAQTTLNNPTPFTLNFNLNTNVDGISPFTTTTPANIQPTTLNAWDEILNTLAENHNDFPANPTRDGYTFVGWYLDAEFTTLITDTFRMPARNATLYARWQKNEPPQITTTSLPNASFNRQYNATLQATSPTPITWSIVPPTGFLDSIFDVFPGGLVFDSLTGTISGTIVHERWMDAIITYRFVVKAENDFGYTTQQLSITVSLPNELPDPPITEPVR